MKKVRKAKQIARFHVPPMHLSCANDELRPVMSHVLIKNNCAVSTDAHILSKINLLQCKWPEHVLEHLNGKMIHQDLWRLIKRYKDYQIINIDIDETTNKCYLQYKSFRLYIDVVEQKEMLYPLWENVIPKNDQQTEINEIGLNMNLLKRVNPIANFMNIIYEEQQGSRFRFFGSNKAVLIEPPSDKGSFVLVMPVGFPN